MNLSKNKLNNDQPKTLSRRDDKKSVNLKWNSKLYFQLSLIVSLLVVYSVMQTKFENKEKAIITPRDHVLEEYPMVIYTLKKPKLIEQEVAVKKQPKTIAKLINNVVEVDNNTFLESDILALTESKPIENVSPEKPDVVNEDKTTKTTYNVLGVEHVPIFPGCESLTTNIEKNKCLSSKINKFIKKRFKADRFDDLKLEGEQIISVQFYIDENGNVSGVIARATEKVLEKEAIRVISKLPKMIPGKQGGHVVKVQYMIPIVFRVK